jgi:UDPglucose--hexose-1-phosphate uridylyltransferase
MAPDLRFDPLGRRNVLLAPERARRGAPSFERFRPDPEPCDFCGGQEARTPPETYAIRHGGSPPDTPGWSVRVVPNLYPATPVHEVVVHTPFHLIRYEEQSEADQADVVRAYRDRVDAAGTPSVIVGWNRGRASGASRSHAHGQIFGLDTVAPTLERECDAFAEACVLCDLASDEELVIASNEAYRVLAHPVPFVADELLIVPRCTARITDMKDDELDDIAQSFATAVRRAVATFGDALPFNLVIHTAPQGAERFHWHAHLMPRIAVWGGLEMGGELPIVAADPYDTARRLSSSEALPLDG